MTTPAGKISKAHKGEDTSNSGFNLFAKNDGFWWPYRSFARALLGTQKNASSYLEANRRLLDEMRNIIRMEQDLVLEISEMTLEGLTEGKWPTCDSDASAVHAIFERATSGVRELGKTWVDVQVRALDAIRLNDSGNHETAAALQHDTSTAAE